MGCSTACPYSRNAVDQQRNLSHMTAAAIQIILLLGPQTLRALPQHHHFNGTMITQTRCERPLGLQPCTQGRVDWAGVNSQHGRDDSHETASAEAAVAHSILPGSTEWLERSMSTPTEDLLPAPLMKSPGFVAIVVNGRKELHRWAGDFPRKSCRFMALSRMRRKLQPRRLTATLCWDGLPARAVCVGVDPSEFGTEKKNLGRIVDPQQNDHQ